MSFALDVSKLGCTNVISHKIDTQRPSPDQIDAISVKLMPYRSPIIYRDKISQMVKRWRIEE